MVGPDTADILNGHKPLPFWKSKKTLTYWFTGVLLLALLACGAPEVVLERIATALAVGLPVLIGGESWLDRRAIKAEVNAEAKKASPQ